jgi:diguanylate cyclase (GGDEF)-like protein/PAS domain S-box-containing protein
MNTQSPDHTKDIPLLDALLRAELGLSILVVDTDGIIGHCNPLAERLLFPRVGPMLGRSVEHIHGELGVDHGRYLAAMAKTTADGEYRFRQKIDTGSGLVHLDSCMLPLYDRQNTLHGFALVSSDCTELVTAEDMQRKLSRAVNQSPVAIIITDSNGTVEYVNTRFSEITGYSAEEIIGVRMGLLNSGLTNPEIFKDLWRTLRSGNEWKGEVVNRRKTGEIYWDAVHVVPITDATGNTTHYLSIQEDISERKSVEVELRRKEARFRAIFDNSQDAIVLIADGHNAMVNSAYARMLGYSHPDELLGQLTTQGFAPEHRSRIADNIKRRLAGLPAPISYEAQGLRRDGGLIDVDVRVSVFDQDNERYILALIRDISERKRNEETTRLWATVFENSGEAVMITDPDNRIVSVNQAFTDITGYAPGEVVGQNPTLLGSGRHDAVFFQEMWRRLAATGHWQGEIWDRRKSGEIYPKWLGISAVQDMQGKLTHYVAIFSDISERKEAQERIEYLARHDPLTGLPNRTMLADRLEQALAHADRTQSMVAMLFLDLDRFKTINDSLGHPVGDALLQEVTARLKTSVRETDTISRLGGDEFVVVITDLQDEGTASAVAQKILDITRSPFSIDGHSLSTSISIGITLFPADGSDFDTLLKKADIAMYHAKDAGRNTYRFFTEQMNVNALERLLIQNRLAQALEKEEFVLHYQPQVALGTGRIIGAEALVRWRNPELGLVPPDRFIPMAEENGAILTIGDWVLREACRQAKAWKDEGLGSFPMAVNISTLQLQHGDFAERVLNIIAETGHDPAMLELEFTESILIQDIERVLSQVSRLKAAGITLAIDDFGTGYSSLSYLKRLNVDRLKIDRSFIRDISTDPDDAAIVRAITQMARSLRLKILAEGAETTEQTRFLLAEGCDEVQGFLYSRPLTADAFARLYRKGSGFIIDLNRAAR